RGGDITQELIEGAAGTVPGAESGVDGGRVLDGRIPGLVRPHEDPARLREDAVHVSDGTPAVGSRRPTVPRKEEHFGFRAHPEVHEPDRTVRRGARGARGVDEPT